MKTLFEFKNEQACSYFLGALLSADESRPIGNSTIWIAPVRHNFKQVTSIELEEHRNCLSQLAFSAGGNLCDKDFLVQNSLFPPNKEGFAVLFKTDNSIMISDLFSLAKKKIVSETSKKCFITGAFDGRSSLDKNTKSMSLRHLVLDCEHNDFAIYLKELIESLGIEVSPLNFARDRLEGGKPRKTQFRIPGRAVPKFMSLVGLISPYKFKQIKSLINFSLFPHNNSSVLFGLKTLQAQPERIKVEIKPIKFNAKIIEFSLDEELNNDLENEQLTSETNFTYLGVPKPKCANQIVTDRKVYKRSKQVAINALTLAKHKCEIDSTHPSFVRKHSDVNYMEPHHLIPIGFESMFRVSLDVEENVISLCSNCHNNLHYGKNIRPLLEKLFIERKNLLESVGIVLSFDELIKMYY